MLPIPLLCWGESVSESGHYSTETRTIVFNERSYTSQTRFEGRKWDHDHSQVPYMGLTRPLFHSPPEIVFERWWLRLSAGGLLSSPARPPARCLDHGDIAHLDSCVATTAPDIWYNYGIKKNLAGPTDVSHTICPSHQNRELTRLT